MTGVLAVADRIQSPNSRPRRIAVFGFNEGGRALAQLALAAGGDAVPLNLASIAPAADGGHSRPADAPDLNLVVVVARPDDDTSAAAAIYRWARAIGVLVTALVVSRSDSAVGGGETVTALRSASDLITMTADSDALPVMLQWLGRSS